MANVRIITDITAHLDPEFVTRHPITILPVEVRFGDETFQIGPEGGAEPLFQRMAESPAMPAQATIPSSLFQQTFAQLSRETDEILVLLSSSKLNQAYAQAQMASRSYLGRCRIVIMDTMTASWGLGLVIEAAARAAEKGHSLDQIVRLIRGILPHIYLVFFVERLDYLERGQRISPAQALLGTLLRIRPVLLLEDGEIIPMEKVRTRELAIEKLASFVAEFTKIQRIIILSSPLNGDSQEMIGQLREQLNQILPKRQFPVVEYDPILACHLGPQALGVGVYEGF
ncbi:MAG: DegV family protein [Anaerolineae bacterium]